MWRSLTHLRRLPDDFASAVDDGTTAIGVVLGGCVMHSAVTTGVLLFRVGKRGMTWISSQGGNDAVVALARACGLVVDTLDPYAQAHGTYRGVRIFVRVGSVSPDKLMTALVFPDAQFTADEVRELSRLADEGKQEPVGFSLYFARRLGWWESFLVDGDDLPEVDEARLRNALDTVVAKLRPDASAFRAP